MIDLILSEVDDEKLSKNPAEPISTDLSFLSSSLQKNYNENSPKPYQKEEARLSFKNPTTRSRRNSIHMDQVPTHEFKPFTINAPTTKQSGSKPTKKGRSLPFSKKKFEEDKSEPNIQKQAKLESRMNNNNLLRSNESKASYNGRGIGSTHLEFQSLPPEQQSIFPGIGGTTSFTYPDFEMPASMQSFHFDQYDKTFHNQGSFSEFKEDLAHNYYPDTEKTGLIMEKKPEAEPENWEALIASNNWNDFSNNDHKGGNFFSFD